MKRIHQHILVILLTLIFGTSLILADNNSDSAIIPLPTLASNMVGTEVQLLPKNFDIWSCDWAPDGKTLIFSGKIQGEDNTKMRIWYWSLDPVTDPTPLTNTDQLIDFSPRWAPDGKRIVMSRRSFAKTNNANLNSSIWLKELPSGVGKQLTIGPEDREPSWSPDGTQIVFSRGEGPYRGRLFIINLADGSTKFLAGQDGELLISPCWGKDGNIYFSMLCPTTKNVTVSGQNYQVMDFGKGGIWSINPLNGTMNQVVVDEFDNRLPAVSPDGKKLAFVSNRVTTKEGNGKFDRGSLLVKDIKSGELYYVTNKVGLNGGSLSWSPDGKKLAFFTFRGIRPAIWVINIP